MWSFSPEMEDVLCFYLTRRHMTHNEQDKEEIEMKAAESNVEISYHWNSFVKKMFASINLNMNIDPP